MGYYTDQLAKIRTAISEVLETGQSTAYRGRNLAMADLKQLHELEQYYEGRAKSEGLTPEQIAAAGRSRVVYVVPT